MNFTRHLDTPWSFWTKVLFRFIFLYVTSYIFLMFGGRLFESVFVWIGENVLHSQGRLEYFRTGSGDTTMDYIRLLFQVFSITLGTVLWSALDRKRISYNGLFYWLTVLIRIFLIYFMFTYGFVKVFKTQFVGPSLTRLLQPVGEMSPMGLAWTYMAYSEGFNIFVGAMEILGGLLLIPRRTVTLGAFITMGVMMHVAMMNFFYDIPVKLFSVNLLLLASILFFIDFRRFTNVFIFNRDAVAIRYYKPVPEKAYGMIMGAVKLVCLIGLVLLMGFRGYTAERTYGDKRTKPYLHGIWEVIHFEKNKDTLLPLTTLEDRWRFLIVDRKNTVTVKTMTDSILHYNLKFDSTYTKASLRTMSDTLSAFNFTVQHRDSLAIFKGVLENDSLNIKMKAKDLSKIRLMNRGFHWVNEYPYNR